jgi:uncharacterized membrane protein
MVMMMMVMVSLAVVYRIVAAHKQRRKNHRSQVLSVFPRLWRFSASVVVGACTGSTRRLDSQTTAWLQSLVASHGGNSILREENVLTSNGISQDWKE